MPKQHEALFPELEAPRAPVPSAAVQADAPLAERMRPRVLDEFVGQAHVVGAGKLLRRLIEEAGRTPVERDTLYREVVRKAGKRPAVGRRLSIA